MGRLLLQSSEKVDAVVVADWKKPERKSPRPAHFPVISRSAVGATKQSPTPSSRGACFSARRGDLEFSYCNKELEIAAFTPLARDDGES